MASVRKGQRARSTKKASLLRYLPACEAVERPTLRASPRFSLVIDNQSHYMPAMASLPAPVANPVMRGDRPTRDAPMCAPRPIAQLLGLLLALLIGTFGQTAFA